MDAGVCDCNVGVQLRPKYVLKKSIFRFGFRSGAYGALYSPLSHSQKRLQTFS